jgi:hypothetical protein
MHRLLATASSDVLLVEPDAGGKILADYAVLARERTTVRLLVDEAEFRPSLIGGIRRWQQRFGEGRNLMVRVAPSNSLYERVILLDDSRAWLLGAPFSHLAKRIHTTLVRMRPEEEARKIELYAEIWEEAKPLPQLSERAIECADARTLPSRACTPRPLTPAASSYVPLSSRSSYTRR